ncbi:MAG: DUF1015 domain-containing protein [Abditibacteriaceae bacterium]
MAEFLPFHGLRYNLRKVQLDDVLAPPYDVVKGSMRDDLLQRSPYNVIEIELPEGDDDTKYDNAAEVLQSWRNQNILKLDDVGFYVYEQEFAVPGSGDIKKRRGVLGALRLEEFGKGVQPHEHTLSGPKQDRLKLLRATQTNISPIFGLYKDDDGWSNALMDVVCSGKPHGEATDGDGVIHRLWHVTDDETVNAIEASLEEESILIADGHHRYETALNYRNECAAAASNWTGEEGANWVMMMCVSTSDPGLIILPTHRAVKNVDAAVISDLPNLLQKYFSVEAVPFEQLNDKINSETHPSIGVILSDASYQVILKEGDNHLEAMDNTKSSAYNELDVTVLHRLILENELGVDAEKLAGGEHVAYTIHANDAQAKVLSGDAQAAFLLRSTRSEQVSDVANAGDKMPQKSTYFYPKLATGLVIRPLH